METIKKWLAKWFNKDVRGMLILIALILTAFWLLGCAGPTQVRAEIEHHSSVPDTDDLATADMIGVCVEKWANSSKYATSLEVCLHDEWHDDNIFGHEPTGTVRLKQPLWNF
jgi:hypothetical protein